MIFSCVFATLGDLFSPAERGKYIGFFTGTFSLAAMLGMIRAMNAAGIKTRDDIMFVGTVGEEGPGDLRGVRFMFNKGAYKDKIKSFFSLEAGSVASLLRELDGELAPQTRLHVIVPSVLYGLDGDIIRLSRDVDWHIVNSAPRVPARPAANAPQRLSLRQREPAAAARYLQAAATAWNRGETPRYRLFEETPEAALDASTAVVFWLAGEASPELLRWVEAGGTALLDSGGLADAEIVARDARGDALLFAQQRGRGRLLSFAAPLKPAALPLLLDSTFAEVLRSTLQPPAAPPDRGVAASLRPAVGAERGDPAARPLGDWLVLAAALLALAERALALAAARRRT